MNNTTNNGAGNMLANAGDAEFLLGTALRGSIEASILEAAHAVHDTLLERLPGIVGEIVDERLADAEQRILANLRSMIEAMPTPTVNIQVPEAPQAEIVVQVPPPRLTSKTIDYDAHGRPATVTEREIAD